MVDHNKKFMLMDMVFFFDPGLYLVSIFQVEHENAIDWLLSKAEIDVFEVIDCFSLLHVSHCFFDEDSFTNSWFSGEEENLFFSGVKPGYKPV